MFRFRFNFEDWAGEDERHIKARLTKETCKFAIVVNHENKLVGFVNTNKKSLVSKILNCMDNQPKIEAVDKMVSDADADMELLRMIRCGGRLLLRVGSPMRRKRLVGEKQKFPKRRGGKGTNVNLMCVAGNNKRRAVILNERKEGAPPSAQNSAAGDESGIEVSRSYFKKVLLRRFNESFVQPESMDEPTESSPKACVDAQQNQAITEDMDITQTSKVKSSSVASCLLKPEESMPCNAGVICTGQQQRDQHHLLLSGLSL